MALLKNKICGKCKKEKSANKFHKDKSTYDGLRYWCKECRKTETKEYLKKHPNYNKGYWDKNKLILSKKAKEYKKINQEYLSKQNRKWRLKNKYGLSVEVYNKKFNNQQGCCAICGIHQSELKRALDVDHNHNTEKIEICFVVSVIFWLAT